MLEDRTYMREDPLRPRWPASVILMGVLTAVFVVAEFSIFYFRAPVYEYFALRTASIKQGWAWQLVTFQFLHGGLLHLLGNLLGLWFFGRAVEQRLGTWHFLRVYFLGGLLGGLMQAAVGFVFPEVLGTVPTLGASAGVFAVFAVYCAMEPEAEILLFFVLPVKAKYLLTGATVIAAFFTLVPTDPRIAHTAHLGGILAGFGYLRWWSKLEHSWQAWHEWNPIRRRARKRELVKAATVRSSVRQREKPARYDDLPAEEFISREVDPILDKISAHGIHSLTERERRILEAARSRMSKR